MILLIVGVVVLVVLVYAWPLVWKQIRQSATRKLEFQKLVDQATKRLPNLPWYEAAWQPEYLAVALHVEVSEARKVANYWVKRGWVTRRRQKTHRGSEVFYFTNPAGGSHFGKVLLGNAAYYD